MLPAAVLLGVLSVGVLGVRGPASYYRGEAAALRAVALRGGGELGSLALVRYSEGRMAAALPLLRAARELNPQEVIWPASEATALARRGRCDDARASLEVARGLDASRTKAGASDIVGVAPPLSAEDARVPRCGESVTERNAPEEKATSRAIGSSSPPGPFPAPNEMLSRVGRVPCCDRGADTSAPATGRASSIRPRFARGAP